MEKYIFKHNFSVDRKRREKLKRHHSFLIWFTGLSGSGKSTIANALEIELLNKNIHTYLLDGDNVRKGMNSDLSFSPEDRTENIRRIAEMANLMIDAGLVVLAAFVSPYRIDRENVRNIVGYDNFVEVFIDTPLSECERRDTKGLYAKARSGEIKNLTGINAPYEAPVNPDVIIDTTQINIEEAVKIILDKVSEKLKKNYSS